jgi:hypothetical protein
MNTLIQPLRSSYPIAKHRSVSPSLPAEYRRPNIAKASRRHRLSLLAALALSALALSALALSAFPLANASANSASLRAPLTVSGSDLDARGTASGSFSRRNSTFTVTASRLDPAQPFQVVIGGVVRGSGVTTRSGAALVRFRSPATRGFSRLDFEPRGEVVELLVNGASVLSGVFAGPGDAPRSAGVETTSLPSSIPGSRTRTTVRHTLTPSGVANFTVTVTRAPVAPTTLMVNGRPLGSPQTPNAAGNLTFRFRNSSTLPRFQPLEVDPRGAQIDLLQDGTSLLSGEMRSPGNGANFAPRSSFLIRLPSALDPAIGYAKIRWSSDERGRRVFYVEIEEVPLGNYTLLVDGIERGTLRVRDTDSGPEGELEFRTHDIDPGELHLTFDPVGANLTILDSSGTTWFSGLFVPSSGGTRPSGGTPVRFTERMTSTGADRDAYGEAHYEIERDGAHYFEVEIEDVAAGNYSIRVGGIHRATLRAFLQDDTIEGEVEFRSPGERGKVTMNFDPRGQLIEIVDTNGTILFSHLFGSGSATNPTPGNERLYLRAALFAQPGAIGSVRATFEIDDDGYSELELEAYDIPVGSYEVAVGGIVRGTLIVVQRRNRTEGEIEFDSDADDDDDDELLLDFPVLDQKITISDSSGLHFSRTLTRP